MLQLTLYKYKYFSFIHSNNCFLVNKTWRQIVVHYSFVKAKLKRLYHTFSGSSINQNGHFRNLVVPTSQSCQRKLVTLRDCSFYSRWTGTVQSYVYITSRSLLFLYFTSRTVCNRAVQTWVFQLECSGSSDMEDLFLKFLHWNFLFRFEVLQNQQHSCNYLQFSSTR